MSMPVIQAPKPNKNVVDFVKSNRDEVKAMMKEAGAVKFKGFKVKEDATAKILEKLGIKLGEDVFWSTPRQRVKGKVFTATEFDKTREIMLHCEAAYAKSYPRILCFHAVKAAEVKGGTTFADLDAVSADLGDIVDQFAQRGVRYVRCYRDMIDIPLSKAFGTDDKDEAKKRAEAKGMEVDFTADGAMRSAHTVRGALPDSAAGKPVHFNQAHMFHPSRLAEKDREALTKLFGEDGLPRQSQWGDGEPIPDDVINRIVDTLAAHTQVIAWEDSDVVLIDNLRFMHGRQTYDGTRRVITAMGNNQTTEERTPLAI
ncbi:MAG: TauD/TfdA family dioxygenase [Pseudomonadota bacterium]